MKKFFSAYWYNRCYIDYLYFTSKYNIIIPTIIKPIDDPDSRWFNKQSCKMIENWLKWDEKTNDRIS
jgi:hypothetical protein